LALYGERPWLIAGQVFSLRFVGGRADIFAVGSSVAQLFPGRITGTVWDAQGAVVPGATVKLSNPTTGQEHTVTTDDIGKFNSPELGARQLPIDGKQRGFRNNCRHRHHDI
jgi:hypothetical protein